MTKSIAPLLLSLFLSLGIVACSPDAEPQAPTEAIPQLFERQAPAATGVTFRNDLPEDSLFHIIDYLYYFDGGGVAAGDVNNDGLVDLYFTASAGPNALYLNRGDLRFEDMTEQAGVAGTADWTKGVTMADVNGDGWLDIFVANVAYKAIEGRNALYINNQDGTFTDRAAAYGLDRAGLSTEGTFFDYDGDGDLDLYVVSHSTHDTGTIGSSDLREFTEPRAADLLYRNDGDRFTDVSAEAGILQSFIGYGLSASASDLNDDGCPDLYVANDFHENDYLYLNNCDGTFTESIYTATPSTSLSSMGSDVGDLNGDGRPDVVVTDMLPDDEAIRRSAAGAENYLIAATKRGQGYHDQFTRNTLQLNAGNGRFLEVGRYAGFYATDWSWATLLADLDSDGHQDVFITNGIYRRPNDLDYLAFANEGATQALYRRDSLAARTALIGQMPQVPIPNYAFQNHGDLTFTDRADAWGLGQPGFSNGAAYADLDNDGDLDLVTNNISAPASIYENRSDSLLTHHWLQIALDGDAPNTLGVGSRVMAYANGQVHLREQFPTRGWQSSVDPRLHIGLGTATTVDSLRIIWPNRRTQLLTNVPADTLLALHQSDATATWTPPAAPPTLFAETSAPGLAFDHRENQFFDFSRESLIPFQHSREGPALAVGDVNGDGLEDVFVGNAKWEYAALFQQQTDGTFVQTNTALWIADSLYEAVDAAFFDADGDSDLDLYVVSAGNEYWGKNQALADRFYRNDGTGTFTPDPEALPEMHANGCCVRPADVDGDGDTDLFVGGRVVTRAYPERPPSYLLLNDGTGRFTDATPSILADLGRVADAAWADLDGDADLDLAVVGDWMPIRVFMNDAGTFTERTDRAGFAETHGWWRHVGAHDLDGDGDTDLVLGNLGENNLLHPSPEAPITMRLGDFDRNGSTEPIITYARRGGTEAFLGSRDDLVVQMPTLINRIQAFSDFAVATPETLFDAEAWNDAPTERATTFTSMIAFNDGDGTFTLQRLPDEAQWAPILSTLPADVDGDGRTDLIVGGSHSGVAPQQGHYDASYGWVLRPTDSGFETLWPTETGLAFGQDLRRIRWLQHADGTRSLLAAHNNGPLQVYTLIKR